MDTRISQISLRSAALSVADLVLPRVCVVCGRTLLLRETHVCTSCAADLPRTFFADFRENPMAVAFNALVESELARMPALDYQPYSYAAALLFYRGDSPYKNIPMRLKYGRDFGEGLHFARMLGEELAASPLFADVDAVIPVPLHWARRWKRGYNQAEVIARGIAGRTLEGLPVFTDILRRVRRTKTQTRLHSGERYANVKSAFVADAGKLKKAFKALESRDLAGVAASEGVSPPRHILLADDVFTTGATLLACERALRKGFTEAFGPDAASKVRISVATLAYVQV